MTDDRRETEVAVIVDLNLGQRRVVTEDVVNVDITVGQRRLVTVDYVMVDIVKFPGKRRNMPAVQWW
jgi:hypothetical protein